MARRSSARRSTGEAVADLPALLRPRSRENHFRLPSSGRRFIATGGATKKVCRQAAFFSSYFRRIGTLGTSGARWRRPRPPTQEIAQLPCGLPITLLSSSLQIWSKESSRWKRNCSLTVLPAETLPFPRAGGAVIARCWQSSIAWQDGRCKPRNETKRRAVRRPATHLAGT